MPNQSRKFDFEGAYFNSLRDTIERIENKVDKNTDATTKGFKQLDGRIVKLENKVFTEPSTAWYQDKKLSYVAGVCLMVFLLIAAAVLGVKIPGGL